MGDVLLGLLIGTILAAFAAGIGWLLAEAYSILEGHEPMTTDPAAPECTCVGLSDRSQVSVGPWHLAECPLNNDADDYGDWHPPTTPVPAAPVSENACSECGAPLLYCATQTDDDEDCCVVCNHGLTPTVALVSDVESLTDAECKDLGLNKHGYWCRINWSSVGPCDCGTSHLKMNVERILTERLAGYVSPTQAAKDRAEASAAALREAADHFGQYIWFDPVTRWLRDHAGRISGGEG